MKYDVIPVVQLLLWLDPHNEAESYKCHVIGEMPITGPP